MRSIKEIFVIGHGPSSSHTMGPAFACEYILNKYQNINSIDVTLYGSLALTGKGHLTDYIIDLKLKGISHTIVFDTETVTTHPNQMTFKVVYDGTKVKRETIISIGGGTILTEEGINNNVEIYKEKNLKEILDFCIAKKISLEDYVLSNEGEDILPYLENIYDTMTAAIKRGIAAEGELPGKLHVQRKAHEMYMNMQKNDIQMNMAVSSFAVAEENAAGGVIAIAPTCGSAGVIPGCITYLKMKKKTKKQIINGLLVAGLFGIIAKTNASVSGAECGCQAEIGVACAMGAALVADTLGMSNDKIAQAAEIAMEHSLGLTCDPVDGYVQIPCIERCAIFALKAVDAVTLVKLIPISKCKVSFDDSLKTMYLTGKDLQEGYRETAMSGLAKQVK